MPLKQTQTTSDVLHNLRFLNFGQRQDSVSEQLSDLLPVLLSLKMPNLHEAISKEQTEDHSSFMQAKYLKAVDNMNLSEDFIVISPEAAFAQRVAVFFGCYDAADYFKHLDI